MQPHRFLRPAKQLTRLATRRPRTALLSSGITITALPISHAKMASTAETTQDLHQKYEPHPDTPKKSDGSADYKPDPSKSVAIPSERQAIVDTVSRLYSV